MLTRRNFLQLGFRVPAIVVSNLAAANVVHHGPYEHSSTLKLIESTFGLRPLTARDRHARDLGEVLLRSPRRPVRAGLVPTSDQVPGPATDELAVCGVHSVQSVSPPPRRRHHPAPETTPVDATGSAGMVAFGRSYRAQLRTDDNDGR